MKSRCVTLVVVVAFVAVTAATAEREPQKRDVAKLVVTGKVEKIETKTEEFGDDGEVKRYVAKVAVAKVEKGDAAKAGDTVEVNWFHVTKEPTKKQIFPGSYGRDYDLKEKDEATFWLVKGRSGVWAIISDGVEKAKK